MAESSPRGWQINKTLVEVNSYMLENQVACDMAFVVREGAEMTTVRAHRYMLIARSPVFEAMLSGAGGFREDSNEVEIVDIELGVFREVLRFMYTDEAEITELNVLHLNFAAKKYMLEALGTKCHEFLTSNLSVTNVCTIFDYCLHYDETDMAKMCLDFISEHTLQILKTPDFLTISQSGLKHLLQCDKLKCDDESEIFHWCKVWAKSNLPDDSSVEAQSSTGGDDSQLRDILGDCVYQIRFGSMTQMELTRCLMMSKILSDVELRLLNIYCSLKTETSVAEELTNLGFNLQSRVYTNITFNTEIVKCWRFSQSQLGHKVTFKHPTIHKIDFICNQPMRLCGIGIYGFNENQELQYSMQLESSRQGCILSRKSFKLRGGSGRSTHFVSFPKPVVTKKNIRYTVSLNIYNPDKMQYSYHDGVDSKTKVQIDCKGGEINFYHNEESDPSPTGQIPMLLINTAV